MAEVIRYVDPDCVSETHNGTSWENAYLCLKDWDDNENTDLATDGNWMHVYCRSSGGTADTTSFILAGWTTSDVSYILIEAASNDRASASGWDAAKYRLSGTDAFPLDIREDYVRLDGLQIEALYVETANKAAVIVQTITATNNDLRFTNCRIRSSGGGTYQGLKISDTDAIVTIYNCIVGPCSDDGIWLSVATAQVDNCTVYGCVDGIESEAGTIDVYNSAVFNNSDDFDGITSEFNTISHCASDDGDTTDETDIGESGGGAEWPDDFLDAAAGDFRIKAGSNLIGAGATGLFADADDIEGTERGEAWDVGAFEYVPSVGGSSVPSMMAYYRRLRS